MRLSVISKHKLILPIQNVVVNSDLPFSNSVRHASTSPLNPSSKWHTVPSVSTTNAIHSSTHPLKLRAGLIETKAHDTWLTRHPSGSSNLNVDYLSQHASTLYLPMELSAGDQFHRSEGAPLSLFLSAWTQSQSPSPSSPSIYIAQAPLSQLPPDLAAAFPIPDCLLAEGDGGHQSAADVYATSMWLGRPPTSTPLHRDPNPNLFVQVAGRKVVRLLRPEVGSRVFAAVRRRLAEISEGAAGGGSGGFGADERVRGHEMMMGPEKRELEAAVWGDGSENDVDEVADGSGGKVGELDAYQATLDDDEALYIPQGWWHAVRGVGQGVNLSVNWWFRSRTTSR